MDYPVEVYDAIFARCAVGPSVLEIGPGTGLATAALLARGARALVAVEPDAALAAWLREHLPDPRLSILGAPFLAVPDGAYDLVAAASSFHWLDTRAALVRAFELLRPGGTLALWWNVYRQPGDAFGEVLATEIADLPMPPCETGAGHYAMFPDEMKHLIGRAGFVGITHTLFRRERRLDAGAMQALFASFSFVRTLPAGMRERLLGEIGRLVDTHFDGAAPNTVLTPLYLATRP